MRNLFSKPRAIRWSKAALVIIVLLLSELGAKPVSAMSFPNGGFETQPAGGANDWYWPGSNWVWDGSTAHSGTHSVRVSRTSGAETANIWSAYVAVQPSSVYTLTYWLRTENATWYPRVDVSQYTSSVTKTGPSLTAYADIGNGTNGWTVVNYHFQSMPNATQVRVRIYLYTDTTGVFWFDDFSLELGGTARFPFQAGFPVVASGWDWLSSPTVADINGDGNNEVLIGAGNALNGWNKTGALLPGFPLVTGDRLVVAQIAVADLDQDGHMEIVTGTQAPNGSTQCRVFAWRDNGALLSGWPQSVAWNTQYGSNACWITSVVLADIDGDHDLEILASTTNNGGKDPYANIATPNLYAWHVNGSLVAGNWPNQQTTAAIYGALAAGDLNGDGKADIFVGRDYLYLNAYGSNGQSLPGWPVQTYVNHNGGNYHTEQRIEFSVNAPIIADLDGDGQMETIVTGHVKGPGGLPDVKLNSALLVLEPDGTRRAGWETAALGNGILEQDDLPWQAPAVADLNGDSQLEIVVATEDGWIRAYKADKTLLWAFNYTQGAALFAGEPVIGDIDGDGSLEVVFGTYVPILTGIERDGPVGLWALRADGSVEAGFPLAIPTPGMRSAPTLVDLDGDGKLEILAATRTGQVFVWHTPTAYYPAQLPWPMGRHDLARTAMYTWQNPLYPSRIFAALPLAHQGETVTFTIHVASPSPVSETVSLTNTISAGLSYVPGTLTATAGVATETAGVIQWSGTLPDTLAADIQYKVTVVTSTYQVISNTVIIDTVTNGQISRTAYLNVNGSFVFLPLLRR